MNGFKVTNETVTIAGLIVIVVVSVFTVPEAAENIILALGGGLVGYLTGKSE